MRLVELKAFRRDS